MLEALTKSLNVIQRKFITDINGEPYLERLILDEKTFLHIIYASDDDRDCHDHPWAFESKILFGTYIEHRYSSEDGSYQGYQAYSAGMTNVKEAHAAHRLELLSPCVTLVTKGPKTREWGFWKRPKRGPAAWVHHKDYLDEKFGPGKWDSGE